MTDFRVFIFADGLVLPVVVHVNCNSSSLADRLQSIFLYDLIATRAEVWSGPDLIMKIDAGGIAALMSLARCRDEPPAHTHAIH